MPRAEVKFGHPRFYEILKEAADLHSRKNKDYAQGGEPLGNFDRRAAIFGLYPGLDLTDPAVVTILDLLKQLDAYLWMKSEGYEGETESKRARLGDVLVYAGIAMIQEEEDGR